VSLVPPPADLPLPETGRAHRRRGLGIAAGIAALGTAAIVALQFAFPAARAPSPTAAAEAFLSAAADSEWGAAAAVMCNDRRTGVRGVVTRTLHAADLGAQLPSNQRVGAATEVSSVDGLREFRVEVLTDGADLALELVVVQQAPGDYRVCGAAAPR
jgi:hypothetical protein